MASSSSPANPTSPPKSPSIHVREPSTTKASLPQSMHTLSPINFTPPLAAARSTSPGAGAGNSIPSSPTSIHSSSSAIFERDIELPTTSNSLHLLANKDPHHTARAAAHEPLENSVPSVLSAAVTALGEVAPTTTSAGLAAPGKEVRKGMSMDDISVIAPAPLSPQNWTASTAGSIRLGASRSPSPHLLPLPGLPPLASQPPSTTTAQKRPKRINTGDNADADKAANNNTAANAGSGPSVIGVVVPPTPNANTFGATGNSSPQSSPSIVTPPLPLTVRGGSRPTSIAMSLEELSLAPLVATTADSPVPVPPDVEPLAFSGSVHPRPPSPSPSTTTASKRLSFISYNDLLNSTPISSFPLSSVTSGLTADTEPPHQTITDPFPTNPTNNNNATLRSPGSGRRTRTNSRQSTMNNRSPISELFNTGSGIGAAQAGARTSVFEDEGPGSLAHSHDVGVKGGGEWEREGLGSGLEERLEAVFSSKDGKAVGAGEGSTEVVGA